MNDKNLSYRAAEVYRTIIAYIESHGYPPTQSEISELCFYSTYITYSAIIELEKKKLITKKYRKPRTIKVTGYEFVEVESK